MKRNALTVVEAGIALANAHDAYGNPSPQLTAARRTYLRALKAAQKQSPRD